MAVGKEIRTKIKSIQNTQKITRAMEMVATSKMRKAQDRMQAARPYSKKIREVVAHLAAAHPEYQHPYMVERPVKRVGYIVISTDRGLCGGLNVNLFRALVPHMKQLHGQGVEIDLCAIGKKAVAFLRRRGGNLVAAATNLGDLPDPEVLRGPATAMVRAYEEGQIDRLFLAGNLFINSMSQEPVILQLLPGLAEGPGLPEKDIREIKRHHWDYIYEPDSKEILDLLLLRYLESLIYRSVVENIACENSARRVAMKSATDNATSLIAQLQLIYNKARQEAITQEISEIVGGAAAV
jgi:F-type H+-transporting ATPase subunit gamma